MQVIHLTRGLALKFPSLGACVQTKRLRGEMFLFSGNAMSPPPPPLHPNTATPSPHAPSPSPAFVLITTSPEQMALCFAWPTVTDSRSQPIACRGIS